MLRPVIFGTSVSQYMIQVQGKERPVDLSEHFIPIFHMQITQKGISSPGSFTDISIYKILMGVGR